jgi:hypothetical protein
MLIKSFANKATTEFMNSREVRYLCRVGKEYLEQFGKLLVAARKCGLVLGKVVTTTSTFYSSIISANAGDIIVELVGILASNKDALLRAVEGPGLSSVEVIMATSAEIDVRYIVQFDSLGVCSL